MLTIHQIKEAHSKVKSGADFPRYVQELIQLGVLAYSTFVADGHSDYVGKEKIALRGEAKYALLEVSEKSDVEAFRHYLKSHQKGGSDYPTFCKQAAETGVEKWTVDLQQMSCTYFDKSGTTMVVEQIPVT